MNQLGLKVFIARPFKDTVQANLYHIHTRNDKVIAAAAPRDISILARQVARPSMAIELALTEWVPKLHFVGIFCENILQWIKDISRWIPSAWRFENIWLVFTFKQISNETSVFERLNGFEEDI